MYAGSGLRVINMILLKDNLPERQFTFWIWFYSILDLVKKNFQHEWQEKYVKIFIAR